QNGSAKFFDDGAGDLVVGNAKPDCVLLALKNFWYQFACGKNERVRAGKVFLQHSVGCRGKLLGIITQVAEVRTNERKLRLLRIYTFHCTNLLDSLVFKDVATQAIDRIGRINYYATLFQSFHYGLYVAGLRIIGMDMQKHTIKLQGFDKKLINTNLNRAIN